MPHPRSFYYADMLGGLPSAGELEAAGVGESSAGSSAVRTVQENTEAGNVHPPATHWPSNFMCWSWPPSTASENDRKNPGT